MLLEPVDPNERFRARRHQSRRRRAIRRVALLALVAIAAAVVALGMSFLSGHGRPAQTGTTGAGAPAASTTGTQAAEPEPAPLPDEIRGVHVTMALASLEGKLDEYYALTDAGLTALELDVKDENGEVAFRRPTVPLAREVGSARRYYDPRKAALDADSRGIYLIGRVVTFEDPVLAQVRPKLAIQRRGGGVWTNAAGLGWTNPYDPRVWKYNVDIAAAAVRAGFDEIMFDYVRFPSDGDVGSAVYRNRGRLAKREAIPAFLGYAKYRLAPFGVRVSAAVFGLSATRDLGVGQLPRKMAPYLDTVYAMTYPSLFAPGELGLADPSMTPGATVSRALRRFEIALRGRDVLLVPWVQDFTFTVPYGLDEVRAQIDAARLSGAKGYMLWNA